MDESFYLRHGALSDPGGQVAAFEGLPGDVTGLCAAVQGVLLHDYTGGLFYGTPPDDFARQSRQTLPAEERLGAILARDAAPLTQARPPFERCVGTCRDFALMLTAMLRHKGTPARVRCGFARYFGAGFEDHWVCEYWRAQEGRWALADPQLDDAHRTHFAIGFDPADMPREQFLLAWEAWGAIEGGADPGGFGHGDDKGLWLVEVNLARDLLALAKQERSNWDGWRASLPEHRTLDDARRAMGGLMAARAGACQGLVGPDMAGGGTGSLPPPPPWSSPV
jgi:hypothetical protein